MQQKARCLKCGSEITFEDGAGCAQEKGIRDQVVICRKCSSVYEISLVPGGMTLTRDVTLKYMKSGFRLLQYGQGVHPCPSFV